jgi:hypothetical protein
MLCNGAHHVTFQCQIFIQLVWKRSWVWLLLLWIYLHSPSCCEFEFQDLNIECIVSMQKNLIS